MSSQIAHTVNLVLSFFLSFFLCLTSSSYSMQVWGLLLNVIILSFTHTHSVGLFWTRDQPVAETSTWQHTTFQETHSSSPHRNSNPQSQPASGRRPTPHTARPLYQLSFLPWKVKQLYNNTHLSYSLRKQSDVLRWVVRHSSWDCSISHSVRMY